MKRSLIALAFVASLGAQAQAADIGVSVSIGHPDFYGRIDIGGYPPPVLLSPQPILIEPAPPGRPPLYLRVPPGHARHWAQHCRAYHACGEPVYFVDDDWYRREYAPRYREWRGEHERREREDFRRDGRYDERGHDHDHDHDRGRGRGRGRDD